MSRPCPTFDSVFLAELYLLCFLRKIVFRYIYLLCCVITIVSLSGRCLTMDPNR